MIKVQTLRLRGLCASSLLALAACSGTPSNVVEVDANATADGSAAGGSAADGSATDGSAAGGVAMTAEASATTRDPQGQDPQGQDPQDQDPRARSKALAAKAVENARRSLSLRLFEDARNEAAYALELDINNAEARDILQRCNQILGDPTVVQAQTQLDRLILEDRIREERERALAQNDLTLGRAHMQQGSFGRAIDSFERAVTVLRFSNYVQSNDPLRKEAEQMLADAREQKQKADQESFDRAKAMSEAELNRISRDQQISRELKVERILEQANVDFQAGNYAGTVERVDQALLLDPANPMAIALRDLADRARHNSQMEVQRERWRTEWNKTFLELQHSNLPQVETVVFDPTRWATVSQRDPATFTQASEVDSVENQAVQKRLEETVLEHNFASATVQDWANYYAQVTGVTFFVTQDVRDMDAGTTTLNEFKLTRRSVADALKAIQSQTNVAYRVRDGLVHLVSPDKAIGQIYLETYKVQDLVQGVRGKPGANLRLPVPGDDTPLFTEDEEDPQPSVVDEGRLQDLLKSTVATDKWDGSPFTMAAQQGLLLVRADKETHAQLDRLIRDLRRHVGIQVDIESRFLRVEDSFLEDVGIDLRGLGNQAAQGLPGRGLEKQGSRQNAGFDDFGPRQNQNAARPGEVGTGTEPGIFFDDGGDGDIMGRVENLYDQTLGGRNGGLDNAGGLSLQYAFLDDTEVEIVLRAVAKQERSEQIEAPRLLVYNNTRASMHFLRNISYIRDFEVEIAQAAAVANPTIGTVHDGVALDVRPVVDSDLKFITMELRPTVMTLQLPIPTFTTTLGVGQPISIQLPEVTLQRIRTTVTMPDGGTMMLGGMRLVERQNQRSTVPLLGSLPGLSWLFSRRGTSVQNRKIIILVKANIVLMEELEPTNVQLPNGEFVSAK